MYKPIVIATGVIIALGATSAGVAAAKLTDPQIAHIVVTADDLDIANAKQALQKSQNAEVQRFAHRMIADHGSVTDQAVALAKKLKITPEDNPTSKSLKDAQDANRTKLDALSGAAFDKAYVTLTRAPSSAVQPPGSFGPLPNRSGLLCSGFWE